MLFGWKTTQNQQTNNTTTTFKTNDKDQNMQNQEESKKIQLSQLLNQHNASIKSNTNQINDALKAIVNTESTISDLLQRLNDLTLKFNELSLRVEELESQNDSSIDFEEDTSKNKREKRLIQGGYFYVDAIREIYHTSPEFNFILSQWNKILENNDVSQIFYDRFNWSVKNGIIFAVLHANRQNLSVIGSPNMLKKEHKISISPSIYEDLVNTKIIPESYCKDPFSRNGDVLRILKDEEIRVKLIEENNLLSNRKK